MKKDKTIIIALSFLLVISLLLLIFNTIIFSSKYKIRESKEEYYEKLEYKLKHFFGMLYFDTSIPEVRDKSITTLTLSDLEKKGYPIEEFVGYNGEVCDKEKTSSLNSLKDNKYQVYIYYVCGEDSNY